MALLPNDYYILVTGPEVVTISDNQCRPMNTIAEDQKNVDSVDAVRFYDLIAISRRQLCFCLLLLFCTFGHYQGCEKPKKKIFELMTMYEENDVQAYDWHCAPKFCIFLVRLFQSELVN